jgi:dTDP-4-amino-4,6-dideoxygalactose transaminase
MAASGEHRQRMQEGLKKAGIPTAVYYPKPLHLQTAFSRLGYKDGDFPHSENAARRIFSLPMHPYLKPEDQEAIAAVCKRIPK